MSTNLSSAFATRANQALYSGADWSLQVDRLNGITLDAAYAHAYQNDTITYFFRVKDGATMTLKGHGTFHSGDTVFFSGNPWYAPAAGLADSYQKNAAAINHVVPQGTYFTSLTAKMTVPATMPAQGVLFMWPGLQPGNPSHNQADSIGNGVLQPVLTYGDSCAPNPTNLPYDQWWISGQYVNTQFTPTTPPEFQHCHGGTRMALLPGDVIDISMVYDAGTQSWTQTCTSNGNSVTYTIGLIINGDVQDQSWLLFINEPYSGAVINGAISVFDVVLETNIACSDLQNYLQSQPQVTGVAVGSNPNQLTVQRMVFHSPIAM